MVRLLAIVSCIYLVLTSSFASGNRENSESFDYDDFEIKLSEAEAAVNKYINEAPQGVFRDFLHSFSQCNIKRCSYMLIDKGADLDNN
jgi:hypothetical protein